MASIILLAVQTAVVLGGFMGVAKAIEYYNVGSKKKRGNANDKPRNHF